MSTKCACVPALLATSSSHINSQQGIVEGRHMVRKLHAPPIVDPRASELALHCDYDLHGNELYSVSWYRNQHMLFKYQPSSSPPGIEFEIDTNSNQQQQQQTKDVRVSLDRSNATHLLLEGNEDITKGNSRRYEGTYACEVLIERTFLADYAMANVSAAILPKNKPIIEGVASSYRVGEQLDAVCTSAPSYPPAELIFQLNGQKVDRRFTKRLKLPQRQRSDSSASSTSLAISMPLERRHFPGGSLKLSCRSILPGLEIGHDYRTERNAKIASADNQRVAQGKYRELTWTNCFERMCKDGQESQIFVAD
ncbi:hypothetical protein QAD02_011783 [Eretmocerus hayati]|uniref:Uncharacterized protein n=1 Tax=Eretmocerus hayati TaxID=131215 RepID=A0ACC2NXZ2_9HYME|nr:hypothetical protein QAD02_011783 [Eretmocerus hayati]